MADNMAQSMSQPAPADHVAGVETEEPTIGRLVAEVTRDFQSIVQEVIQLAKSELKVSVSFGGVGAALLGMAAFLVLLGIIILSIALGYFLTMTGLHPAWCFLIVFGGYLLLALILALVGVRKLKKVRPPERAIRQAQGVADTLKR